MNLTNWSAHCHQVSKAAGWWEEYEQSWSDTLKLYIISTKFALIHSEISEAFEGFRKDKMDDHLPTRMAVEVELADTLIRIFDLAGRLNLDLENAVKDKIIYNLNSADHKIENRRAVGGKKF